MHFNLKGLSLRIAIPELINLYRQVADHVDDVICKLKKYENTQESFYAGPGTRLDNVA